ncbi:MAG: hypothetical protein ABWZ25_09195 [Chitinophagaceae bacterium]
MGRFFRRTIAIVIHGLITYFILTLAIQGNITSSWIKFVGFISLLLLLLFFFTLHIISFFYFVKSITK